MPWLKTHGIVKTRSTLVIKGCKCVHLRSRNWHIYIFRETVKSKVFIQHPTKISARKYSLILSRLYVI